MKTEETLLLLEGLEQTRQLKEALMTPIVSEKHFRGTILPHMERMVELEGEISKILSPHAREHYYVTCPILAVLRSYHDRVYWWNGGQGQLFPSSPRYLFQKEGRVIRYQDYLVHQTNSLMYNLGELLKIIREAKKVPVAQ